MQQLFNQKKVRNIYTRNKYIYFFQCDSTALKLNICRKQFLKQGYNFFLIKNTIAKKLELLEKSTTYTGVRGLLDNKKNNNTIALNLLNYPGIFAVRCTNIIYTRNYFARLTFLSQKTTLSEHLFLLLNKVVTPNLFLKH